MNDSAAATPAARPDLPDHLSTDPRSLPSAGCTDTNRNRGPATASTPASAVSHAAASAPVLC